ncbi:LuxR C-terminal-related transcriptional regulator [Saccharopolyspora sp. K220]|uniref:helix-turn-helix transcriptional regulator n=1 Tax=Saccharopolyspora soli TaxID=2926618 RepID=UPI001F583831|nr:LuxR C-terminal-related transcriptional regulator [Saccharopolyspora soli]MCI2423066.1 LuxR C-terminal-related transcriptional regulator [Saccharopolyspora soli]
MLSDARLVTLIGLGGVGKTRLALHAASSEEVTRVYDDGVWLADLTRIDTPDLLRGTVAQALGVQSSALQEHLASKHLLLVLDNCEHLTNAVAELCTRLLQAAPDLHILATSRHVLDVPGEQRLPVGPLALPPERATVETGDEDELHLLAETAGSEAVALFAARAREADPSWRLGEDNRALVARLVRALDGIPLAIELAARRLRTMSLHDITEGISDRFALLTTGRGMLQDHHATLAATLDWSWELLTDEEQRLFARLGVLNQFTAPAAAAICAGRTSPDLDSNAALGEHITTASITDVISDLVDKSLIIADTSSSPTRYRLLETTREYALRHLRECGEETTLRRRHAQWLQAWTARAADEHRGPHEPAWLAGLHLNMPNVREALDFCSRDDPIRGLAIINATVRTAIWEHRGALTEAAYWMQRLLAAADATGRLPARRRADALAWTAMLHCQQGSLRCDELLEHARQALPAGTNSPDVRYVTGAIAYMVHREEWAIEVLAEAAQMFAEEGRHADFLIAELIGTIATAFLRPPAEADEAVTRHLAHAEATRGPRTIAWARFPAAVVALRKNELARAEQLSRAALLDQRRPDVSDEWWGGTWGLRLRFWILAMSGDHTRAAVVHGAATNREHLTGVRSNYISGVAAVQASAMQRVLDGLGQSRLNDLMKVGQTMDWDTAVAQALGEPNANEDPAGLTDREREVAELIAHDWKYQSIGARLGISRKTVETYAGKIRTKLMAFDPTITETKLVLIVRAYLDRLRGTP